MTRRSEMAVELFMAGSGASWSGRNGWRAWYLIRDADRRVELREWPVAGGGWAVADGVPR